jgi:GTP cyclohydrolase II
VDGCKIAEQPNFLMDDEHDLRRAEEHVTEGRRIVQQQKGRIVRLRAAGADTWEAERTLRLFESNLRRFEEHRHILKARK